MEASLGQRRCDDWFVSAYRFRKERFKHALSQFVERRFRRAWQFQDGTAPIVHLDLILARWGAGPDDPLRADQETGLAERVEGLKPHRRINTVPPRPYAAAQYLRVVYDIRIISAPQAQNPNLLTRHGKAG